MGTGGFLIDSGVTVNSGGLVVEAGGATIIGGGLAIHSGGAFVGSNVITTTVFDANVLADFTSTLMTVGTGMARCCAV